MYHPHAIPLWYGWEYTSQQPLLDMIEHLDPRALEMVAAEFGPDWRESAVAGARAFELDRLLREEDAIIEEMMR